MIRSGNEDSVFAEASPYRGVFMVADGMGGHAAGEVASAMAVQIVTRNLERVRDTSAEGESALRQALRNANQAAAAAVAERNYALRARLAPLATQILVLRLREEVVANKEQARDLPARARLVELPAQGASLFETAPEVAAQALEAFLR